MINETDKIHEEVGLLAHQFVLADKKKKESEEEELLISIEDQKKISYDYQREELKFDRNPRSEVREEFTYNIKD